MPRHVPGHSRLGRRRTGVRVRAHARMVGHVAVHLAVHLLVQALSLLGRQRANAFVQLADVLARLTALPPNPLERKESPLYRGSS